MRTVSATFQAGMISDDPQPGSARYIENMAVRPDGLIPLNPVRKHTAEVTALQYGSGAYGTTTATVFCGFRNGGTYHPKFGLVALADTIHGNVVATTTAWPSMLHTAYYPALVNSRDGARNTSAAVSSANLTFVDNTWLAPIAWRGPSTGPMSTAAATATMQNAFNINAPHKPWFINTEDEVLMVDRIGPAAGYTNANAITRYAGSQQQVYKDISTAGSVSAISTSVVAMIAPTATGVWTDECYVYGGNANIGDILTPGGDVGSVYIGIALGQHNAVAASTAEQQMREFRTTAAVDASGSPLKIKLDRKIYFSTTLYARCVISNTAVLQCNQLSTASATQPFGSLAAGNGFYGGENAPTPRGPNGAVYHNGRLFLLDRSTLRWSADLDESLQLTATSNFATATSTTSTIGTTGNFGIEFKHISLYSTAGFLNIFPGLSGDGTGLASIGDELVIMKNGGMFRLVGGVSYDGASNAVDLQVISDTVGPESVYSWAQTQEGIIFTHDSRIWLYDGNELKDISAGTIANSFQENLCSNRFGVASDGQAERIPIKVTSGGDRVYFSPMRYGYSTSTGGETVMTTATYSGSSIYNKHLVLNLRDHTWSYLTHSELSTPAAIVSNRSVRGTKMSTYWLPTWRTQPTSTAQFSKLELVNILNMFHDDGPVSHGTMPTSTAWTETLAYHHSSHVITHPLLGMGNFDALRPRNALIKHTAAIETATTSNSTALNTSKVYVKDIEASHVPIGLNLDTTAAGRQPEWWDDLYSDTSRVSDMASTADQARGQWDINGTTSTARAISLVDRITLDYIESAMTAPSIHYRDDYWWKDRDSDTYRYGSHILHGVALTFDDVPNGSDR